MKIIITSDDFGKNDSINQAIDYAIRTGACTEASLMVNMDAYENAVLLARGGGYLDRVSFHLNLTEGVPLTERIKNTCICKNGQFKKATIREYLSLFLNKAAMKAIEDECEAQILRFQDSGFTSLHFDAHNWISFQWPIWISIRNCLKKYGFNSMRPMEGHFLDRHGGKTRRAYMCVINRIIKKQGLKTVCWSGCLNEFFYNMEKLSSGNSPVEVYLHPNMVDGQACDTLFCYKPKVALPIDIEKSWFCGNANFESCTYDAIHTD